MAFVTIDNPAGIQHHGGQMAWTTISDTRVAMVTFTTDNKALIQEINQVAGAPVVGVPSFIAQVPTPPAAATYFRPKIKYMGNDRVFVMIPADWRTPTTTPVALQSLCWGSAVTSGAAERLTQRSPTMYTGYVMERNSSGQYTVKSSVVFDTMYALNPYFTSSHFALTISSASDTQIVIRRATAAPQLNSSSVINYVITIPVTGGVLGTPAGTTEFLTFYNGFVNNMQVFDFKTVRDLTGRQVELWAINPTGQPNFDSSQYRMIWRPPITTGLKDPCYLIGGQTYNTGHMYRSAPVLERLSLGGIIAPSADQQGDYYAVGGATAQNSVLYNANVLTAPDVLWCPLDTGYVNSDGVVCVVGGRSTATSPYVTFDNDVGTNLLQIQNGTATDYTWPLKLSFRAPVGVGHYIGPFDPIQTPYFYKDRMNNNRVLHRVDDTHFWLIGCFMADANATPKLGVISVSV